MNFDSPYLIIVMGLPGSGKTYFAIALAKKLSGIHINSDIVRKRQDQHPGYTDQDKAMVYQQVYDQVHRAVKNGKIVIVDATFSRIGYRQPYFTLARQYQVPVKILLIRAGEQTIAKRMQKKREYSDADLDVYHKIKAEFEPLASKHLILDSDKLTLEEMLAKSIKFIKEEAS